MKIHTGKCTYLLPPAVDPLLSRSACKCCRQSCKETRRHTWSACNWLLGHLLSAQGTACQLCTLLKVSASLVSSMCLTPFLCACRQYEQNDVGESWHDGTTSGRAESSENLQLFVPNGFDYETVSYLCCMVCGQTLQTSCYISNNTENQLGQSQMSKSLLHPVYLETYLQCTLVAELWVHMFTSSSCDWLLLSFLASRQL